MFDNYNRIEWQDLTPAQQSTLEEYLFEISANNHDKKFILATLVVNLDNGNIIVPDLTVDRNWNDALTFTELYIKEN